VIAGSRHGTPFDAIDAFNGAVLGFLEADAPPDAAVAPDYQSNAAPV
jgi:hypothetical protein